MNKRKSISLLVSTIGLLVIFLIPVIILSCKNVLMEVLEAPEISVIYDNQEIRSGGEIRLGSMELGTTNSYDFTIKNKGKTGTLTISESNPVTIGGIDASMLSVSAIEKTILKPEESTQLTFTFAPFGSIGEKSADIMISSNDEDEGTYTFTITAEVVASSTDLERPTVEITTSANDPSNISPIPITITFSEEVVGSTANHITITGGYIDNLQTTDNTVFTADITKPDEGEITVYIQSNSVTDISAHGNIASNQFIIVYDATSPAVTVTSDVGSPTNVSPIPVTITFSVEITGFDSGDIEITNATIDSFSTLNDIVYTITITSSDDPANITIVIPSGCATGSSSGLLNNASEPFSILYDAVPPTVAVTSTVGSSTNIDPFPVTITFSEVVINFDINDITVGNGTVINFDASGNPEFSAEIDIEDGAGPFDVTIDIASGAASDAAGNTCSAAEQLSICYNADNPSVNVTSDGGSPTNASPIPVTITFSERMDNFESGDVNITGGSIDDFSSSDFIEYAIEIIPSGDPAAVVIVIPSGVAQGSAGGQLLNTKSNTCEITYDGTDPTGSMQIDDGNGYTNITDVDLDFSSDGTGTETSQMQISNDSNFSTGDGWEVYSATKLLWSIDGSGWDINTGTEPGIRTVYYRFKDAAGNDSPDYSAAITQTRYGRVGISIFGGALFN